jgi:plasmid stabilization system protein ParE
MKVTFEPAARDDLDHIFDWIANQNRAPRRNWWRESKPRSCGSKIVN